VGAEVDRLTSIIDMKPATPIGRRCTGLATREFWLSGRLVDEFCAIFLWDNGGDTWKIFLDDEDNTWKLEQTQDAPAPGTDVGDDQFRYPAIDLLSRFPIKGQVIQSISESNLGTSAQVMIGLSSGKALVLDYEYATERTTAKLK
jgi:hypothetical protein